ncbi:glycosyltransferase family 2 protein [Ligilactobacillus agilis]|uniref:glycosyltransferase family 2 protein n=1 Tax=Ligilactobacillus agilis TaxID=1601 RepID=UPI003F8CE2EE
MDKITVIVPVYNVEQYLDRCVNSILNQTYRNLEIILLDDGSTDNSGKLCDSYKDERIVVVHKKNEGLGLTRNVGIKKATGKYIVFIDSDDYIDTTMIENLYLDLKKNNADTCIGGFKRIYKDRVVNSVNPYAGKIVEKNEILTSVLSKMFGKSGNNNDYLEMSVWKVLFSRDIIVRNRIFFPSEREFISEDIIFDTEYYSNANRVYMSSDVGYNYCDNEGTLTTRYNPNRFELQEKLYLELDARAKKLGIYENVKARIDTTLVAIARYSIKLEQKFSKQNGRRKAFSNIKRICNNSTLEKVLLDYNLEESKKSKVVNDLIKNKNYHLLWYTMLLKNRFGI